MPQFSASASTQLRVGAMAAATAAVVTAISTDRLLVIVGAIGIFELATFLWATAIDRDAVVQSDAVPQRRLADRCRVVSATLLAALTLACVLLLSLTGQSKLGLIANSLHEHLLAQSSSLAANWTLLAARTAAVSIFVSAAVLLGSAPVHQRAWDWSDRAAPWESALWLGLSRALGLALAWRVGFQTLAGLEADVLVIAVSLSLLTLGLSLISLWQRNDLQGIVARLTVTHVGLVWLVIAAAAGETRHADQVFLGGVLLMGVTPAIIVLSVASLAQWVVIGIERVLRPTRVEFLEELTGLGRSQPIAGGSLSLALLSLTPLPPLPGFWSWFWVLGTAFVPGTPINEQAAAVPNPAILACALVAIAVVLAATMRVIQVLGVMYWHEPLARLTLATESWIFAVSVVGALLLLTCGLSPTVVIKLIDLVG